MAAEVIAIASDHAGIDAKDALKTVLTEWGYEVLDLGPNSAGSVDYPDFADALTTAIGEGQAAEEFFFVGLVLACPSRRTGNPSSEPRCVTA